VSDPGGSRYVRLRLSTAESTVAALLTLLVLSLHYINATSAGGLWRDEANTVGLSTLRSVSDVWNSLQYDSFPILWLLIVRAVATTSGYLNDPAFRALGFCVGAGIVGAIWYYARTSTSSAPLLSLALLAMHPVLIRYGDSMRAYGFGILTITVTAALMWRFVREPRSARFVAVSVAAILSVHALYYNAVLIAALCAGALAVCAFNRAWKRAMLVVLIGLLAAISLVPYVATIRGASDWVITFRLPEYTVGRFLTKLEGTLRMGGIVSIIAWITAFAAALICGLATLLRPLRFNVSRAQQEVVLFNLVTLLSTVVGIFLFLKVLSYPTEPWYYLSMLGLAGVCIDSLLGTLVRRPVARVTRLAAVVVLAGATFLPARRVARGLETTVDIIASRVQDSARSGDLIVVANWYEGVTFARYYRGEIGWLTVPQIDFHRFHRYDLVMEQMKAPDQEEPVRPVIDGIKNALSNGHKVYVVGLLYLPTSGRSPIVLPPAPLPGNRWPIGTYEREWSSMVADFLQRHTRTFSETGVHPASVYNIHENVRLFVATGWRP